MGDLVGDDGDSLWPGAIAPRTFWADHYHKSSHQSGKRNLAVEWWGHYDHWQFALPIFTTPCGERSLVPKITSSDFDDGIPLDELPEYWPRCFVTRNKSTQSRWRCQMVNVAKSWRVFLNCKQHVISKSPSFCWPFSSLSNGKNPKAGEAFGTIQVFAAIFCGCAAVGKAASPPFFLANFSLPWCERVFLRINFGNWNWNLRTYFG